MSRVNVSVVIATLNSAGTLPRTLKSLVAQTVSHQSFEIIVVDGGSSDETVSQARQGGARVVSNPRTQQNYGKYLGYLRAKGRYVMFLDSDEVLENKNSLKKRIEIFKQYPQVKAVIGSGYKNPPGYPFINQYLSEFGDPFSFFIYRLSKDAAVFGPDMQKRYPVVQETKEYFLFDFTGEANLPLIELTAGGSMFDATFLKQEFSETKRKPELINHAFYLLQSKSPFLVISKKDAIWHYSAINPWQYLNKLSWRVKVNLHYPQSVGGGGFAGRHKLRSAGNLGVKEYFFIPYAGSLVAPFFDSIYLSLTRGDVRYLWHLPLCAITLGLIIYHGILRIAGVKPPLLSYGGKKPVKTN